MSIEKLGLTLALLLESMDNLPFNVGPSPFLTLWSRMRALPLITRSRMIFHC